jgi:hypothetical protein
LAAALLLFSPHLTAHAGAITVSEGQTVIFSFDFTGLSASQPPYPDMRVHTGIDLDSIDGDDRCRFTLYRDPDAVNADGSIVACGILTFEAGDEESGWLDGVLSIALTVLDGAVTLDPHARAFTAFGAHGEALTPRVLPRRRVVPEPPMPLPTLLVAAALLWGARRSRSDSVLARTY